LVYHFIGYNVLYYVDSSSQNHPNLSELKYFTVLECKDFKDVRNKAAWKDDANENVSSAVLKLASELNVNSNYKEACLLSIGCDTLSLIISTVSLCPYSLNFT
jgi:hypothetical protein